MKKYSVPKLTQAIVSILDNLKFTNIVVCDTQKNSVMFDKVVIATCNTPRQAQAAIRDIHKAALPLQNIEGQRAEEWFLADCGSVVAHMMLPKVREYFRLEELWQDEEAPKKVAASKPTRSIKSSTPSKAQDRKTSAKKKPASQSAKGLMSRTEKPKSRIKPSSKATATILAKPKSKKSVKTNPKTVLRSTPKATSKATANTTAVKKRTPLKGAV